MSKEQLLHVGVKLNHKGFEEIVRSVSFTETRAKKLYEVKEGIHVNDHKRVVLWMYCPHEHKDEAIKVLKSKIKIQLLQIKAELESLTVFLDGVR